MKKELKLAIIIELGTCFVYILSAIFSYNILTIKDNRNLKNEYESKKEEYEILQEIKNEVVEGKCINTDKIPTDKFAYELSFNENNILLNFYLKEDKTVWANITFTKDYEIISQLYNPIVDNSFEEYKSNSNTGNLLISFFFWGLLGSILYLVICFSLLEKKYKK